MGIAHIHLTPSGFSRRTGRHQPSHVARPAVTTAQIASGMTMPRRIESPVLPISV